MMVWKRAPLLFSANYWQFAVSFLLLFIPNENRLYWIEWKIIWMQTTKSTSTTNIWIDDNKRAKKVRASRSYEKIKTEKKEILPLNFDQVKYVVTRVQFREDWGSACMKHKLQNFVIEICKKAYNFRFAFHSLWKLVKLQFSVCDIYWIYLLYDFWEYYTLNKSHMWTFQTFQSATKKM